MLIATHDGTFHADETTACAILSYLYPNCSIIRSRDPEELEKADLIIDVSNINDERHFDHHSKEFTDCRENGIKYATAGIIWEKYGLELPFSPSAKIIENSHKTIDVEVMQPVDLNDNGQLTAYVQELAQPQNEREQELVNTVSEFFQTTPDLPYLVAMSNLTSRSEEEQFKAFLNTVRMLRTLLVNIAVNTIFNESGIARVIELYQGEEILIMHERLPWTQAVLNHPEAFENCKLAVYPDRNKRWRVQSLPKSKAERFVNRLSAPLAWRGLNDEELDRATGISNTTFVHKSGFTGGAKDYDSNLKLAKLWLKLGVR